MVFISLSRMLIFWIKNVILEKKEREVERKIFISKLL